MTDVKLLSDKIKESGYRKNWIAKQLHMAYGVLISRLRGDTEFKQEEIAGLSRLLNLTTNDIMQIFFAGM